MVANTFLTLSLIVLLGSLLTYFFSDLDIDEARANISRLVLGVFLPALNFQVIYSTNIGNEFWKIPLVMFCGLIILLCVSTIVFSFLRLKRSVKASMILGSSFSNVTYLGIPVLRNLFPEAVHQVTKTAILSEMTLTPLNLIVGSALASFYGDKRGEFSINLALLQIVKMPLIWAVVIAIVVNLFNVPVPEFILKAVDLLAATVSGLMMLVLGMALKYSAFKTLRESIHVIIPFVLLKLALLPFIIYFLATFVSIPPPFFNAVVIESAMPSQLIVFVTATRYGLDTEYLAIAVFITTVISFLTLPLIHILLL